MKKTLLALSLLTSLQGWAAPVGDQHWSLLANQLFPALMDLSKAHLNLPILNQRRSRIEACQQTACTLGAGLWTDAEIDTLAAAAAQAPASAWHQPALADDGVKAQVTRELRGLNGILQVYGQGAAPRRAIR